MDNLNKIVRKNILNLEAYSSARDDFKGLDGVFLDANENPFGKLNRYPDPYQLKLKNKLAELKNLSTENIFISNGSDEVIDLAFRIFCNPGKDKALTFTPTYGMYDVSAAINDVELIKIPLAKGFQIDVSKISEFLKESTLKVIFICSPNNPTGNLINKKDIEIILNLFKGIIIIDEAYIDFSESDSWTKTINENLNLIVSQTFSKARGLAAARVGVAYSNPLIIDLFNKVKPPYNVSQLNQEAALKSLINLDEYKTNLNTIFTEKMKLQRALEKFDSVKKVYPSDANFLLIEIEDTNSVYNELVRQKIIIRNRNNLVRNCLRISIGTPEENKKLLNALKNITT